MSDYEALVNLIKTTRERDEALAERDEARKILETTRRQLEEAKERLKYFEDLYKE